ncbi:hypothetical protein BT69DRAFT_1332655 [Atractiella rhizophila]|nr:hypothetical protein BT69DRAFT_1332655 [Atractiella rhizophila]
MHSSSRTSRISRSHKSTFTRIRRSSHQRPPAQAIFASKDDGMSDDDDGQGLGVGSLDEDGGIVFSLPSISDFPSSPTAVADPLILASTTSVLQRSEPLMSGSLHDPLSRSTTAFVSSFTKPVVASTVSLHSLSSAINSTLRPNSVETASSTSSTPSPTNSAANDSSFLASLGDSGLSVALTIMVMILILVLILAILALVVRRLMQRKKRERLNGDLWDEDEDEDVINRDRQSGEGGLFQEEKISWANLSSDEDPKGTGLAPIPKIELWDQEKVVYRHGESIDSLSPIDPIIPPRAITPIIRQLSPHLLSPLPHLPAIPVPPCSVHQPTRFAQWRTEQAYASIPETFDSQVYSPIGSVDVFPPTIYHSPGSTRYGDFVPVQGRLRAIDIPQLPPLEFTDVPIAPLRVMSPVERAKLEEMRKEKEKEAEAEERAERKVDDGEKEEMVSSLPDIEEASSSPTAVPELEDEADSGGWATKLSGMLNAWSRTSLPPPVPPKEDGNKQEKSIMQEEDDPYTRFGYTTRPPRNSSQNAPSSLHSTLRRPVVAPVSGIPRHPSITSSIYRMPRAPSRSTISVISATSREALANLMDKRLSFAERELTRRGTARSVESGYSSVVGGRKLGGGAESWEEAKGLRWQLSVAIDNNQEAEARAL